MKFIKIFALVALMALVSSLSIQAQESTQEPDMMPEVTEVPQFDSQGYVRFGHFVGGGPTVDIIVDDETVATAVEFTQISDWMTLSSGSHSFAVVNGDETLQEGTVDVTQDVWVTVGILPTDDGLGVSLIQQNMYTDLPTTSQVTFANGLSSMEGVNFLRDDVVFVANLPVTTGDTLVQNSIPVDAKIYRYNIAMGGQNLVEDVEVNTIDTSSYLVVAVGSSDNPQLIVDETPNWKIRLADGTLEAPATLLRVLEAEPLAGPFLNAVKDTEIADLLTGDDPITIFVPADYVFDDVDLSDENLMQTLRHHIVDGDFKAGALFLKNPTLETIDGNTLTITETEQGFVNGAQIIEVNLGGSNGTVHIINAVLDPSQ